MNELDIRMPDEDEREGAEINLRQIAEQEALHARLARVFGTADGIEALEWLFELLGYWLPITDVTTYEVARRLEREILRADVDLYCRLMTRQSERASAVRAEEKKKLNERLKERR